MSTRRLLWDFGHHFMGKRLRKGIPFHCMHIQCLHVHLYLLVAFIEFSTCPAQTVLRKLH